MSTWKILEGLLREARQYLGETDRTLSDVSKLLAKLTDDDGAQANPEGDGLTELDYPFNPSIPGWNGWWPSMEKALRKAATSSAKTDIDITSATQGGTVTKTNWGGRVGFSPGKARTDFERLPTSMDRYDVLMIADILDTGKVDKNGSPIRKGVLKSFAYSPAVGPYEERRSRLHALVTGRDPGPLSRRPQPERPNPPSSPEDLPGSQDRPKIGTVAALPDSDDNPTASMGYRTGQGSQARKGTYKRPDWYVPGRGSGKKDDR